MSTNNTNDLCSVIEKEEDMDYYTNPPDEPDREYSIDLVIAEMDRVRTFGKSNKIALIEKDNSHNDRIAIALAYLGRSSHKVLRNISECEDDLENVIKACAVLCCAIDALILKRQIDEDNAQAEFAQDMEDQ